MKLIVTIPDEVIEKESYANYFGCLSTKLYEVIKNGTLLPKGHGRLIDVSKLNQDIFDDNSWQYSGDSPNEGYSLRQIKNADTIIEADIERNSE